MAKKVFYDEDARKRVLGGAEILYNAVKTTMGPKGRNVVISKGFGGADCDPRRRDCGQRRGTGRC